MAITFNCECGQQLQAQEEHAGRRTRCPQCGRELPIPAVAPARPPEPPLRPEAVATRPRSRSRRFEDDDDDGDERRRRRSGSGSSGKGWIVFLVLAILGVLGLLCLIPVALLVPAISKVRSAATRMQSHNNLKMLALGLHAFHDRFGQFPPATVYDRDGNPLYSWRVLILPYIGEEQLFREFHLDEAWDSPHNKPLLARMPKMFAAPGTQPREPYATYYQLFDGPGAIFNSDKRGGLVDFDPDPQGIAGLQGGPAPRKLVKQSPTRSTFATIADGTSNTILIAEAGTPVPWSSPGDLAWNPKGPLPKLGGLFNGDINVAMADGSTRFVSAKVVSEQTLRAAITANGGEVLGQDW
jgi:hypothetical protein